MRELEFLPEWYPQIRRRRRMVVLQGWIAVALAIGLGLWVSLAQRNVRAAEATLDSLNLQLTQTDVELQRLDDLMLLQRQWRQQDQIISRLGLHVESTRMLQSLVAVMPPEMALIELTLQVEEQPRPLAASLAMARPVEPERSQRRLKVRLVGVAPTGVDLARFLTRLSDVPFFEQVAMVHLRDRTDRGHVMREFEVNFVVSLNPDQGNP